MHTRRPMFTRCQLQNPDGSMYFRQWTWMYLLSWPGTYGIHVHNFPSPDQTVEPHGHPRPFVSIILSGGYTEEVYSDAPVFYRTWRRGSIHKMPVSETHRVIEVEPNTWTLVFFWQRGVVTFLDWCRRSGFFKYFERRSYDRAARNGSIDALEDTIRWPSR